MNGIEASIAVVITAGLLAFTIGVKHLCRRVMKSHRKTAKHQCNGGEVKAAMHG